MRKAFKNIQKYVILKKIRNNGVKSMKFRPCIDIHNGKVKQIVGGSLKDRNDQAIENFVSEQNAEFFAELYRSKGIS